MSKANDFAKVWVNANYLDVYMVFLGEEQYVEVSGV